MANLTAKESKEHKALVGKLIAWMKSKGFVIQCASYGEYPQCDKVVKYKPDCMGKNAQGLTAIGEAKIAKSIDTTDTKDRFKEFANQAQMTLAGYLVPFYIAIPTGSEDTLKKVLAELGYADRPNIKWCLYPV